MESGRSKRRVLRSLATLAVCAVVSAIGAGAGAASPGPPRPFVTAVFVGGTDALTYRRVAGAGARVVRILFHWREVAPTARPAGFDPTDPADPAYRWSHYDAAVRHAAANRLEVLLSIMDAPVWAQRGTSGFAGTIRPDPKELAAFATAAARRYGGGFERLPRVRYWQVWNEPNLTLYLSPQFVEGRPVGAEIYRGLVNATSAAVHRVHADNLIVGGGQTPFTFNDQDIVSLGPLAFMRQLFCLRRDLSPLPRCARTHLDVWAHHPYTAGGPRRSAARSDDVSLGDLPEMARTLRAAERAGRIATRTRPVPFWVTEFSWDTSPPDPRGVPSSLHARWVAEALHQMWRSGVALATWFGLRDEPVATSPYQSGLWFRGETLQSDRPKPALRAFEFPFVAYAERGGIRVWGRTPDSRAASIIIERSFLGGWARVGSVRGDRHGVFSGRLAGGATRGYVRARVLGSDARARPFSLRRPADRVYQPFGSS